jgi:alpha-glucosidase
LPKPIDGVAWAKFDFESFDGGRDSKDSDLPDLYIRPGSIIVTCPVTQYFGDRPDQRDEITLLVHLDATGQATGTLYEDAGEGMEYMMGQYLLTTFNATSKNGKVTVEVIAQEGKMTPPERTVQVRIIGE